MYRGEFMVGERLIKLRKSRNMNQEQLANELSLSKFCISQYEKGKNNPSEETIIKIARMFGVTSDYLLGLSDEKFVQQADNFCFYLPKGIPNDIKAFLRATAEHLHSNINNQSEP